MRIGLLIYDSLDTVSGGYLYDRQLVAHLRACGDQIEIVSIPWRSYRQHLGDNLSAQLRQRMNNLQVDILLQDELNHPSLFWLNRRLKPRPYKIVAIVHHLRISEQHSWPMRWLFRQVERSYLKSVDAFVYNSQTTRQVVEAVTASRRPGVVALPAGDHVNAQIGAVQITERAQQPGPLRVVFIGNLIPRKGLEVLLSALARTQDGCCQLSVIGNPRIDPRYSRSIQRLVHRLALNERVRLLGRLAQAELRAVLRESHVLVVPSQYEGFGIVYLEGMGFGMPAVASTGGGAAEIITSGKDGYLIHPGAVQELADYLTGLNDDRSRLVAMGVAARQRYERHPTWEQTAGNIRTFLEKLAVK